MCDKHAGVSTVLGFSCTKLFARTADLLPLLGSSESIATNSGPFWSSAMDAGVILEDATLIDDPAVRAATAAVLTRPWGEALELRVPRVGVLLTCNGVHFAIAAT
mmetsp:Transcript_38153/g.91709  ORF Transcript_38153/g.91709 Transcript_38153/m.91709 type:complete len:105 (+) Transcript_38153:1160-1474(+)